MGLSDNLRSYAGVPPTTEPSLNMNHALTFSDSIPGIPISVLGLDWGLLMVLCGFAVNMATYNCLIGGMVAVI